MLVIVTTAVILGLLIGLDYAEYVVEQKIAKQEALEEQDNGEV